MGGHIPVAVRRANGSVRTIGVWTNPLKSYVLDRRFIEGSLDPIDEFFARYLRDDQGEDSFGGPQAAVPGEYGFVLIDAVDKVVMNWSHYTRLSECRLDEMGIDFNPSESTLDFYEDEHSVEMRAIVRENLRLVRRWNSDAKGWMAAQVGPFSSDDEMAAFLVEQPPEERTYGSGRVVRRPPHLKFVLGSPAWEFIELDHHSKEDFALARARVEASISLSAEEKAEWDEEYLLMFGDEDEE
ncbi:hypothetical protein D3C71_216700 [compost metagenome]